MRKFLNKKVIILILISFFIILLGNGKTLYTAYTPDDYMLSETQVPLAFYLQQGRFIQGLLVFYLNYLDYPVTYTGFLFSLLFFLSFAISIIIGCYLVSPNRTYKYLLFPILLISSSTFISTLSVYHMTVVNYTAGLLLLSLFFISFYKYFYLNDIKFYVLSVLSIALIPGSYQPILPIAIFWSFSFFIRKKNILRYIRSFSSIVLGVLLYLLIFKLTKDLAGENNWDPRSGYLEINNLLNRFFDVVLFLKHLTIKEWWIIPKELNVLYLILFIMPLFFLSNKDKILYFLYYIFSLLIIILPVALLKDWEPTHRALFSVSFLGGFLILNANIYHYIYKRLLLFFVIIITLLSLVSSNVFLSSLERENSRNEFISSMVAIDLNRVSDISNKNIVIYNKYNTLSMPDWAVKGLFFFSSGYRFNIIGYNDNHSFTCEVQNKFPNHNYIMVKDDDVFICF